MLSFAFEGITSLSTKPIRMISVMGILIFLVSLCMLGYFFIRYVTGNTVVGWASLAVSLWALWGVQLLAMGIIGEYVGKVYLETKQRPRYIVEQYLHEESV